MSYETSRASYPTPDDVRHWEAELEQLKAEEAEMKARHAQEEARIKAKRTRLHKLIEAATGFIDIFGDSVPATTTRPKPEPVTVTPPPQRRASAKKTPRRAGTKTWTATIAKIVRSAARPLTYAEIRDELGKTHLAETLARTDKAFYGALYKLEGRGNIIKYNGRIFSPAAHLKFMADVKAGRVEDIPYVSSSWQESPNEIAIHRLLAANPDGLTTRQITDSLLSNPPPDLKVTKNRNSLYNLLARERDRGNLEVRDGKYFLPRKKSEPSDSKEPDGSRSHGEGSGSPSSSGGNGADSSFAAHPGAILAHPGV